MDGYTIQFTEGWDVIKKRLLQEVEAIESIILDSDIEMDEIDRLKTKRSVYLEVINLPETIKEELDARGQGEA